MRVKGRMKGRTKNERDGAAFPGAKAHEGVMDTAEEGATEVLVTVHPHGAGTRPSVLALGDEGGPDGGPDEGQDRDVTLLPCLVSVTELGDDRVLATHVVGVMNARATLVGLDGLQSEPLSEGVGRFERLGTHALAAWTAVGGQSVTVDRWGVQ